MKKCLVALCKNYLQKTSNVNFFKITEERYESWMKAIGRNQSDEVSYDNVICSEHFKMKDYIWIGNRVHLKKCAVPSINLKPAGLVTKKFERKYIKVGDKSITGKKFSADMITDADPLEISVPDSLSLFGDSVDNIEFVIENEDEPEDCEVGTKDNPIVIHITKSEEDEKQLVVSEHISKFPVIDDIHSDMIDLDLDSADIGAIKEIKIEEEEIHIISDDENEKKVVESKKVQTEKTKSTGTKTNEEQTEVSESTQSTIKKPNPKCYVPHCTVSEDEENNLYWFRSPGDKNLRKVWDICIDHPNKRLTVNDVVCHQHFPESDIFRIINENGALLKLSIKDGAVPCINFHEECCVPNCNTRSGLMYNFPVIRKSNYDLWLYMIKNPDLRKLKMKEVLRHRVCTKHFESDCFEHGSKLRITAAPTLFLPEHNINQLTAKIMTQEPSSFGKMNLNRLCCTYGGCLNNNLSGKQVFKFPQDPDRCIAWLKACHRESLITTPEETVRTMASGELGVCEDHFEFNSFETRETLKNDAVPRLHVQYTSDSFDLFRKSIAFSDTSNSAEEIVFFVNDEGARIMPSAFIGICSYRNCASKVSADNPFFSFPVDPIRCEQWLKACGLTMVPSSKYEILKNQRICSKHFEPHMFEIKNKLKRDAVPITYKKGPIEISRVNMETKMLGHDVQSNAPKTIFCAVSTCPNNYGLTQGKGKFPHPSVDRERFDIWLRLLDNAALKEFSPNEIYEKFMVCMKHFEPQFYMKDGKVVHLSKEAVPTLQLTADIQWFKTSDYYKNRLQKYLDKFDTRFQASNSLVHNKQDKSKLSKGDVSSTCVLEEDGIRFLSTGHYIRSERNPNSKRKLPYDVYKFFNSGYGLNADITIGEHIKIHTAIIIDDDDDCERQVLQKLLDKRKKY